MIHGFEFAYPRTVLFGEDDQIYVGDTQNGQIYVFNIDGTGETFFSLPDTEFPYLAGVQRDSLVVFNPERHQFSFVVDQMIVDSIVIANVPPNSLQYALANETQLFLKAVTRDSTHYLWTFSRTGNLLHESILYGSSWEHAGFLRSSDDQLVSLSGFYPRALTWPHNLYHDPDTLQWWGFDSPMLRRTYAFGQGRGRGAPLLSSSATSEGEYWFVLNQRAGWLRIDIYSVSGMLQHILIEANPEYIKNFYPIDLAVTLNEEGSYHLAVALVAPDPSVRLYTWTPPNINLES